MRFAVAASALSLAALAAAQDATVMVGAAASAQGGPYQFTPPSITAKNGSVITFMYTGAPGNHTVTQSSFDAPCQPLANGFDSGYIFVPPGTTAGFPTWNLTVTDDTKPLWFFCAQRMPTPHCVAGMVGSINAPTTGNTFDAFQTAAKGTNGTLPGIPTPALSGVGAAASAAPGPFSGSITGFGVPGATGAAAASGSGASGSAASGSAGSASSTGTGAPAATKTAGSVGSTAANGAVVFMAALLGITVM